MKGIIIDGKVLELSELDDLLRIVIRQSQPVTLGELVGGLNKSLITASMVHDRLNDLIQSGRLAIDDKGRYVIP